MDYIYVPYINGKSIFQNLFENPNLNEKYFLNLMEMDLDTNLWSFMYQMLTIFMCNDESIALFKVINEYLGQYFE